MATQTPNLNLKKPAGTDYVLVGDLNGNMDIVDTTVGKLSELDTAAKTNLVAAINEANESGASAPYVGENGNWYEWDSATRQYVDTGVHAKGDTGDTGTAAGFGTPTAAASGLAAGATPTVSVEASGSATSKVFAFQFGIPKGDTGSKGNTGDAAGFGTPTATVQGLAAGASPTVSVVASGSDIAKIFAFAFGIPKGDKGNVGETGAAAGFGTPTATVTGLEPGQAPTVTIQASGSDVAKVFGFNFGIPKGDQGNAGNYWYVGNAITGTSTTPTVYPTGIENAQIGDMYLNNGALPNTGRAYRCTLGGNASTAKWVYSCLLRGADGTGTGDMLKSVYDSDNDGIVDDSEKLGGNLPAYYAAAANVVPKTRKVNNKALSSDISLTASDVGADASGTAASAVSAHDASATAHLTQFAGKQNVMQYTTMPTVTNGKIVQYTGDTTATYTNGHFYKGVNGAWVEIVYGDPNSVSYDEQSGKTDGQKTQARANIAAAAATHAHGSITNDGKVGSVANLPLFTGTAGSVGTKSVVDAKIALNIAPHKYLYAGRDLSTIFTAAQLHAAVAAGDFSNIRIGDYWPITLTGTYYDYADSASKTLSNAIVNLEVAGIDTFLQYGDTAVPHHLVMVSRDCLPNTVKMRSENSTWYNTTVTNPWLGSAAYETFNNETNGLIKLVAATPIGAYIYAGANAKGMRFLGETKAAAATAATSWAWLDRGKLWLPTEREVWGQDVWSEHSFGGGVPIQYPIFQGGLRHIIKGLGNGGSRYTWWCSSSNSGSAADFCLVAGSGDASGHGASGALGVPLCFLLS